MSRIPHNKITPPDFQTIYRMYIEENHSREECSKFFNVHPSTFKSWVRMYGLKKERSAITRKRIETNNIRYGGDSPASCPDIKAKIAATNMARYGGRAPMQNSNIVKKAHDTLLSKYGVLSTWDIPEVRARQKEIMEKTQNTTMQRYGSTWYSQSKEYSERVGELVKKSQETHIRKYGAPVYTMTQDFKEKLPEIQARREQTNLSRYGEKNYSQTEEFRHKAGLKYWFDGQAFDSSWELALWIYAKDHREEIVRSPCRYSYEYQGKIHYYFPDFSYRGLIIEIKGDYFFDEDGIMVSPFSDQDSGIFIAKQKCMEANGVTVWTKEDISFALDYVNTHYGKNFLKSFKR